MWGIMSPHRPERCSKVGERRFPYGTSSYCHFTVRPKESLSGRSAEGAELLGRRDFHQRDIGRGHLLCCWGPTI
jgi:hypothetical protein